MLAALTVYAVWISSIITINHQLLIVSNIISAAYAQRESMPSGVSTPFLEWYEKQKYNLQTNNSLSVKIMSPVKDEQELLGQGIIVSGISTDNATSDCQVSVIVNNVKPYQPAVANGTGGTGDYSTWNFMITPTYTTIKEGPNNKITSKLECAPNLTKWYSVNVTGVNTTTTTNIDRAETAMQAPFVLFPLPTIPDNNNTTDSVSTLSSTNTSNSFSTDSVGYPSKSSLSISLNVTSNSAVSGDDQTIEATVLDAVSHLQIDSAILELEITDSAGNTIEEFSDDDGSISYTFEVGAEGTEEEDGETVIPGIFTATLRASAVGYEPESKTTTFNLVEQDEVVEDNNNDIIDDEEDLSIGDSNSGNELFE
jgi:hypothetical protein